MNATGRKCRVTVYSLVVLLLASNPVLADRGMIPVTRPDVVLYEPGQKALIAWNGSVELLVLSTDVKASGETMVLEVLPLPSKPTRIEKSSSNVFKMLLEVVGMHVPLAAPTRGKGDRTLQGGQPGVEIVFHEKIGAHDITVAKANNVGDFIEWGEGFLENNSIRHRIKNSRLEVLVSDYIKDGVNYFVFDLVNVSTQQKSVEPVLYEFETDHLFYPMSISSIVSGETNITLFTLTPSEYGSGDLSEGLKFIEYASTRRSIPLKFKVTPNELKMVSTGLLADANESTYAAHLKSSNLTLNEMFPAGAQFAALEYKGPLGGLSEDFIVGEAYWRKKAVEYYLDAGESYRAGNLEEALAEAGKALKLFDRIGDSERKAMADRLSEEIMLVLGEAKAASTKLAPATTAATRTTLAPASTALAPAAEDGSTQYLGLAAVVLLVLALALWSSRRK